MGTAKETGHEYEQRVKWFRDAGFGMFIHWGLYSLLGHGEWAQWRENIHPQEYRKLAYEFNPINFDPHSWIELAKKGGAKYVVFTTRHHDGFSLWDTKVSDFKSTNFSTQRDFVAEYINAVRDAGLNVGLYYSPMDWSWPGLNLKLPGDDPLAWQKFVEKGPEYDTQAWGRFCEYVHEQVRELMTNYGKIDLLWYDGCWYQTPEQWQSHKLNRMVRDLQPHIVINNRAGIEEDYDTPENEMPIGIKPQSRPWEVCMCMNDSWGYIPGDQCYKTPQQLINTLVRVRSGGGNILLNISPDATGKIPLKNIENFQIIGKWLKDNGESFYGATLAKVSTHGTGYYAQPGLLTAKPESNTIYYHILRYLGKNDHCVKVDASITSASLLIDNSKVEYEQNGKMVYFKNLPKHAPDPWITVIKLQYDPSTASSAWTKNFV